LAELIAVNDGNFEEKVLKSPRPVLADFSATWCGPCKQLKPIVEALADEYAGRVDVVHIDVDEARDTAARFGVMSVPTLLFFKNGEPADQVTGVVPGETLKQKLDRLLS
jgi:thioredoxin 1